MQSSAQESTRQQTDDLRIIGEPECKRMTTLDRVTRWRLELAGRFPTRVRLTGGRVGWFYHEVKEWLEKLPRGAA